MQEHERTWGEGVFGLRVRFKVFLRLRFEMGGGAVAENVTLAHL